MVRCTHYNVPQEILHVFWQVRGGKACTCILQPCLLALQPACVRVSDQVWMWVCLRVCVSQESELAALRKQLADLEAAKQALEDTLKKAQADIE